MCGLGIVFGEETCVVGGVTIIVDTKEVFFNSP